MTQEDKNLFLKDLSARLCYGVRLHISSDLVNKDDTLLGISLTEGLTPYITHNKIISTHSGYLYSAEEVKPYLRPMSSVSELISAKEWSSLGGIKLIDWYNANHIDYRGLIEKGLALEAPEGMYNIK